MKKNIGWHAVLVGGILVFAAQARAASSDRKDTHRMISVQGQGRLPAVPDVAYLTVEVRQEGASLDALSAQVRQGMTRVLDVLKAQGIADKDLRTVAYRVEPRYERDQRGNTRPNGYVVLNRAAVKIHDLKNVGKVLTAAVQSGATSVAGPDFDFDNPQQLERKALALAMEDARAKAGTLAEAAGARLGSVETVSQMEGIAWPRHQAKARMLTMAAEAEPIVSGEQTFTSTIQATFALQ